MKSCLIVLLSILYCHFSFAQRAIGYIKAQGNDDILNLRVISEADAISAGQGVVPIVLPNGTTGAAELVPTSDPEASEIRIQTPSGTRSWKKERYYSYSIGGSDIDELYSLVQTGDGGFALCGLTTTYGAGGYDFMFLKLDEDGDFDWGKALGYPATNKGKAITYTHLGGYYLTGYAYNPTYGSDYAYVYHLDNLGNIIYEGGYGTESGEEYAEDCIQTSDNNFVIIGQTDGMGAGGTDVYVKKSEYSDGDNIWGWAHGTSENESGYSIVQRSDGGYVAVGKYAVGTADDAYILYLDSGGIPELSLTIGGDGNEHARDVVETSDGSYVYAGPSSSGGAGSYDFYMRKLDAAGNPLWAHYYGGANSDICNAVIETSDNNLVMVGNSSSFGVNMFDTDVWIVKTDALGNAMWSWVFGAGDGSDEVGYDIIEGENGCLYVCGIDDAGSWGDGLFIKLAGDGTTCMGFRLGFSGGLSPIPLDSTEFRAKRIYNFSQSTAHDEINKIHIETYPIKSDLIRFNGPSRDAVDIVPTVTTICN